MPTKNNLSSSERPVRRSGLRTRLQKMKSETVTPQATSTCSDDIQSNVSKIESKKKKDAFFSSMLSNSDTNTWIIQSEDDIQVLSSVDTNDFIFNPLDVSSRKTICKRLDMPFRKADLNHENIGENLSNRTPKVKTIGGDGKLPFPRIISCHNRMGNFSPSIQAAYL